MASGTHRHMQMTKFGQRYPFLFTALEYLSCFILYAAFWGRTVEGRGKKNTVPAVLAIGALSE